MPHPRWLSSPSARWQPRLTAMFFAAGTLAVAEALGNCGGGVANGEDGCCRNTDKCPACCFNEESRTRRHYLDNFTRTYVSSWSCSCSGCGQELDFVANADLTSQSACADFLTSSGDVVVQNTINQSNAACQVCFGKKTFAFHPSWLSTCSSMYEQYVAGGFVLNASSAKAVCSKPYMELGTSNSLNLSDTKFTISASARPSIGGVLLSAMAPLVLDRVHCTLQTM